jgi:hypothetical protein
VRYYQKTLMQVKKNKLIKGVLDNEHVITKEN